MRAIETFLDTFDSIDKLPPTIAEIIRQHQTEDTLRGLLVIPPQYRTVKRAFDLNDLTHLVLRWRKTPQRTLAFGSNNIVIIERHPTGELKTMVIPIDSLFHITIESFLLHGTMKLTWIDAESVKTVTVDYHTVNEKHITRQIDQVRVEITARTHTTPLSEDPDAARRFAALPLKFHNFLWDSILPDEHLRAVVFEPAVLALRYWFKKTLVPNRAIALTDLALIVLEEDKEYLNSDHTIITHYYPLAHIQHVDFGVSADTTWLRLLVGTVHVHQEIEIPVSPADAEVLQAAFASAAPATVQALASV